MTSNNSIINSLGLTPIPFDDNRRTLAPQVEGDNQEAEEDIQNARDGLYRALDYSRDVVEDMLAIARQSQHPKAYEILNSSVKTLADISSEIGSLQLKKQRLKQNQKKEDDSDGKTINQNVFVGSTAEFQQLIASMRKGENG